jgi:hypothetical protein
MGDDRRARRAALGVLVFLVTLPLQWQLVASTPLGQVRIFDLGAVAMLLLARPSGAAFREVVRASWPFAPFLIALTFVMSAFGFAWHFGAVNPIQNLIYAGIGLAGAAALLTAIRDPQARRILAWAAPITTLVFLLMFSRAMHAAGVNPVSSFKDALEGKPQVFLHNVYRVVFRVSNGNTEESWARHEMYAALVLSGFVSVAAGRVSRGATAARAAGILVIVGLLSISMSRAVMLAAILGLIALLLRALLKGRVPVPVFFGLGLVILALPFVWGLLVKLVYNRFADQTASYNLRVSAFNLSSANVLGRFLLGGPSLGRSTHTMIGDATLEGSIVAGILAVGVVFVIARLTAHSWLRFLRSNNPLDWAALAAGIMVIVRSFTSGGGELHQVQWMAFGLLVAVSIVRAAEHSAAERRVSQRSLAGAQEASRPYRERLAAPQGAALGHRLR